MLILLPPSETKDRPSPYADPMELGSLSLPALTTARQSMLRAVQRTATGADGAARLGVPASAPELTERMAHLDQEPAGAPLQVYSGVLFDQLAPGTEVGAERTVLIQSALLGLVDAATDRIPAYRVSATSRIQRLGTAGTWWRKHLTPVVADLHRQLAASASPLFIDCRSGAYRSMMPMSSTEQVRVLQVSPVQERGGARKVVSHDAKRYRGWVTRALLDATRSPATAQETVELLRAGFDDTLGVELHGDELIVVDRVD